MREFTTEIVEGLRRGLRPNQRTRMSPSFLTQCFNAAPSQYGLRIYEELVDPFGGNESASFPFPQIFSGLRDTLLCHQTDIKSVDKTATPWSASSLTTYDPDSTTLVAKSITGDGVWHFADFGEFWFLLNGTSCVFQTGLDEFHGESIKTWVEDAITINTGCAHRGRMITGGFNSSDLWDSDWVAIWNSLQAEESETYQTTFRDIDQNYVMWSSIGEADFPLWLMFPNYSGYSYDLDVTAEQLKKQAQRNEFGWMPMPWDGQILKVKPLGQNVIVYGENGISALVQTSPQPRDDMPPTYGLQHIANFGIHDRGAVAGNKQIHTFIDRSGELKLLDSNLQVQSAGYNEYFEGFTRIASEYSERHEDFYFSDKDQGFILSLDNQEVEGLGEMGESVTGFIEEGGENKGLSVHHGNYDLEITTTAMDMGVRGHKTITQLEVGYKGNAQLIVSVEYRLDHDSPWEQGPTAEVDNFGNAYLRITATEFRFQIVGSKNPSMVIDYLLVKWQSPDKRTLRGPNARTAFTRTS